MLLVLIFGLADERDRAADRGHARSLPLPADRPRPARARPHRGRHRAPRCGHQDARSWRSSASEDAQVGVPGAAHFFVFWAFLILATVYLEAYGSLLKLLFTGAEGSLSWAIPVVGHWAVLGFLQDFIAVMALFGIVTFAVDPAAQRPQGAGPQVAVLRLAPRRRLADAVHDLQRHLDDVPVPRRGLGRWATCPTTAARSSRIGVGNLLDGLRHERARGARGHRPAAAHRRDAGLPDLRAELQAPAHLPGAAQRALRARARSRWAR